MEDDQQEQEQNFYDLFAAIHQAIIKSKQVLPEVIGLVGMSRVGKTTIIRWMTNPASLIGDRIGANRIYVDAEGSNDSAQIGHKMVSVTLLPNTKIIKMGYKEVMIVDFGGFGERKGAVDVIKVNYGITSYLLSMTKVRFIIVIPEKGFTDISSHVYRDSFSEFLNMFDLENMKEEERQELFSSVSICVTAARDLDDGMLVDQLKENNEGLKQLNDKNKEYMPKYIFYEQLIKNIMAKLRVTTFPEAIPKKRPPKCTILEDLDNNKGWNQWSFNERRRDMICCPFGDQFSNLSQNEKEKCVKLIKKRFGFIYNGLTQTFNEVLLKLVDHLTEKEIDLDGVFKKLEEEFISKHKFFGDILLMKKQPYPKVSVVQRLILLRKLYLLSSKMVLYSDFIIDQKNTINWIEYQKLKKRTKLTEQECRKEAKLTEYECLKKYYGQILSIFKEEMIIFQQLLGTTSQRRLCLDKIIFIVEQTLEEIIIFQSVKKQYDDGGELTAALRKIYFELSFGNIFIDDIPSLDLRFIEQFIRSLDAVRYQHPRQYQECIDELIDLEVKYPKINTMEIYSVVSRLFWLQSQLYSQNRRNQQECQCLLKGLFFSMKQQACLEALPTKKEEDVKNLIKIQQDSLKSVMAILIVNGNVDKALRYCDELKQYSMKTSAYKSILKRWRNIQYLRQYAEHCRNMGQMEKSIELYEEYMKETKKDCRGIIKDIEREFSTSRLIFQQRNKEEQTELMPLKKLVNFILDIENSLFGTSTYSNFKFEQEAKRYRMRMGNVQNQQMMTKNLPSNPSNIEYYHHAQEILPFVENKLVTILLASGSGKGMTVVSYAVAGKTLQFKEIKGEGNKMKLVYDRLTESKDNRINHNGDKPTAIPCLVQANEEEVILDSGLFLDQQPDRVMFVSMVLEQIIKKSKGFRFMLVVKEGDVLESQCEEIMLMLSFICTIFQIQSQDFPYIEQLGSSLSLLINFSQNHSQAMKKIKKIGNQLNDKLSFIENQRKYHLPLKLLEVCHKFFSFLQKRPVYLKIPESNIGKLQTNKFLKPQEGTSIDLNIYKWSYLPATSIISCLPVLMARKMLESEVNTLKEVISKKLKSVVKFIEKLFLLVTSQYEGFKDQNQRNGDPIFEQIYIQLGLPLFDEEIKKDKLEEIEQIKLGACRKKLNIISQLLEVREHIKSMELFDFWLPDDYSLFYDKLISITTTVFDKTQLLCCNSPKEHHIMKVWKKETGFILEQLRLMSETLGKSDQFSMDLIQIRNLWDEIIFHTSVFDGLSNIFSKICSLPEILQIGLLEQRQDCLSAFKLILQSIQNEDNNWQILNELVQATYSQIDIYKEMRRTSSLVEAQLYLTRIFIKHLNPQRAEIEGEPKSLLSQIACQVAPEKPEIALKIGEFIGCEYSLSAAYEELEAREKAIELKTKYLIILVDLAVKLKKHPSEVKTLFTRLHSLKASNKLLFPRPEDVCAFRQKQYPFNVKNRTAQGDAIYSFLDTIEKEIRQ